MQETSRIVEHLLEIRRRLLSFCWIFLCTFAIFFYFSTPIFHWIAKPLLATLPSHQTLIATSVTGTLVAPLKLSFFLTLFLTIPLLLYQLWTFVAPGLYSREKLHIWPLLLGSTLLFYLGMLFCYWIVLPLMFRFFLTIAPNYVTVMPDIDAYVTFCLKLFLAFGMSFETPIITLLLIIINTIHLETVKQIRPYALVIAFTLGMLLTPPDVLSQILLAVPLYLLFELGIVFAKLRSYFLRQKHPGA